MMDKNTIQQKCSLIREEFKRKKNSVQSVPFEPVQGVYEQPGRWFYLKQWIIYLGRVRQLLVRPQPASVPE